MSVNTSPNNPPDCRAEESADLLRIGGVTAFTATDYPGLLSAVVFVQGCPWRCGYCHNPHLQSRARSYNAPHWRSVRDLLKRRAGLVDAVVFSGGEPTIDPALEAAIDDTRALGFKIGVHSGGAYPRRLQRVLPRLDWIGFDVKAPFDAYDAITGMPGSGRHARDSAAAILASGIEHEFRTTIHPHLHDAQDVLAMAHALAAMGVKNYALQVFRTEGCADAGLNSADITGYPGRDLVRQLTDLFPSFTLRDTRAGV